MVDWSAIGALSGAAGFIVVIGSATVTAARGRLAKSRTVGRRLDLLEIRLFGLPSDPATGAPKVPGEFDRIDRRLDTVLTEIKKVNGNGHGSREAR